MAELRLNSVSYYQSDALGSVTSLTSSSGTIAGTYTYDSFGKLSAATGSVINPFQYTGREFDIETGTYFHRARYYDPNVGRFLSEDPTGFGGGTAFYRYVNNRPTVAFDPSGLVAVIPLPDSNIHRLPDIDPFCGITAGGCNKVDYRPDFTCEKLNNCDTWKAKFTIRLVGDIYVATNQYP
jgi:RHS repeat-associated protein